MGDKMTKRYVIDINERALGSREKKVIKKIEEDFLAEKGIRLDVVVGFYVQRLMFKFPLDKGDLAVEVAKRLAKHDIEFVAYVLEEEKGERKKIHNGSKYKFLKELKLLSDGKEGYEAWKKFKAVESASTSVDVVFLNVPLYLSSKESILLPYPNIKLSKEERDLIKEFLTIGVPSLYPLSSSKWSKAKKVFDRFFALLDEKKVNVVIITPGACPIHLVADLERIFVKKGFQIWYHSSEFVRVNEPDKQTLEEIRKELLARWNPSSNIKTGEPLLATFSFDKGLFAYRVVYKYKRKRKK